VDDDLDLLHGEPPAAPPRRPMGPLLGALIVVALLAVVGVFWLVSAVADRGTKVGLAAPTSTPAPSTAPAVPTSAQPPTIPATLPTATFSVPAVPSSLPTPLSTIRAPAPKPTPKPIPTTRPAPTPVGKLVTVPDVTGLRVTLATSQLRAAGLKVQVLGGVLDVDRDRRRVIAERPTAGSVVLVGSTVILVTDGV
jgi:hypothetical protein